MTVEIAPVVTSVVVLLVMLLARVPVAFSLATASFVGYLMLDSAMPTFGSLPFSVVADYHLVLVPMFMVMGLVASAGGILTAVFDLAERLLRRLPGGLAIAATVSAGFLGGISGSSVADTATLGRVTTDQMSRRGYNLAFSAAVVASSNTVAILIPPSLALVLVGIVSEQPIGPLLLAGLIPGLITVVAYAACCLIMARLRPRTVFTTGRELTGATRIERPHGDSVVRVLGGGTGGRELTGAIRIERSHGDSVVGVLGVGAGLILMAIVLGGLYSGIVTAVEAGFAGAAAAIVLSLLLIAARRRLLGQGRYRDVVPALGEAAQLTGMIFLLLIGATLYSSFLIRAGVPNAVVESLTNSAMPALAIVAMFLLFTVLLGMVLDPLAILLIVGPIAFPVVIGLDYSGIWFAVLFVKAIEIGLLTPPVGMNAYVVASVNKDLRVEDVFKRLVPFITTEVIVLTVLFFVPTLSTWLASTAR